MSKVSQKVCKISLKNDNAIKHIDFFIFLGVGVSEFQVSDFMIPPILSILVVRFSRRLWSLSYSSTIAPHYVNI